MTVSGHNGKVILGTLADGAFGIHSIGQHACDGLEVRLAVDPGYQSIPVKSAAIMTAGGRFGFVHTSVPAINEGPEVFLHCEDGEVPDVSLDTSGD